MIGVKVEVNLIVFLLYFLFGIILVVVMLEVDKWNVVVFLLFEMESELV